MRKKLNSNEISAVVVIVVVLFLLSTLLSAHLPFVPVSRAQTIIARVQSNTATGTAGNTLAATFPGSNTAGNLLIVVAETDDGGTATVNDSVGNSYTQAKSTSWDFGLRKLSVYYANNVSGGPNTVTLTSNTTGGGKQLQVFEYSGLADSNVLDQSGVSATIGCTNTCITSPSVTTTQANELLFAAGGPAANATPTAGSGYTLEAETNNAAIGSAYIASEDQIVSTAGSYQASFTFSSQSSAGIIFVTFAGSGTGGSGITNPPIISNVQASAVTSSGATLTWTTDENSDSQVNYGTTSGYGSSSNLNSTLTTTHTVTLSGLSANTVYHYQVRSSDASGNVALSADNTFTTQVVVSQGAGTTPTLDTWMSTNGGGYTTSPVGYDKSVWVNSTNLKADCIQTNYLTRGVTSEIQDAISCYDYANNWTSIVEQGGGPHTANTYPGGHSVSVFEYYAPADALIFQSDGSYGNSVETMGDWWTWYVGGSTIRDTPFPVASNNANQLTRFWHAQAQLNMMACDPVNAKCLVFPDFLQGGTAGTASICNINSSGIITFCGATSAVKIPPSTANSANVRWDADNHLFYVWGSGALTTMTTYNDLTDTWTPLSTTCTGLDCVGTHPPARQCDGMDYSTADHVFLLMGGQDPTHGCSDNTAISFNDTWQFTPSTNAWTELCGPSMIACGYPNTAGSESFDRLTYDPVDNVFILIPYAGPPWVYALSTPLAFGRSTPNYNPPSGSLNRTTPVAGVATQGNTLDVSASVSGSTLYIAHTETGPQNDGVSNCRVPTAYISSMSGGVASWIQAGSTQDQACTSIRYGEAPAEPMSHVYTANIGGTQWALYEKHNAYGLGATASRSFFQQFIGGSWYGGWLPQTPGGSLVVGQNTITLSPMPAGVGVDSQLFINQISVSGGESEYVQVTGTTASTVTFTSHYAHSGTWTVAASGFIDCFTADCSSVTVDPKINSYPAGLIAVGNVPTASFMEENNNVLPHSHQVYVAQFTNGAFSNLGSGSLNINSAAQATYASEPATDGAGNIAECWTEEVNSAPYNTLGTTPQVYCKLWNGTSWSQMGSGSLNQLASDWAYSPTIAYWNGNWYVAYTESSLTSNLLLHVLEYNASAKTWSAVGGGSLNINASTGMAYTPSLTATPSNLYIGWNEQATTLNHSLAYVKAWNGSSWSQVGGVLNADPVNGSAQGVSLVTVSNEPTAVWSELTYGNLRQVYAKQWNGSNWIALATPSQGGQGNLPLISSFSASPSSITSGSSSVLSWSVSGATSLSVSSVGAVSGSQATVSPAATTNYTLTATDSSGSVTANVTVTVSNAASDTTPPSIPGGLSATAASASSINLSWTASTDNVGVAGYHIYRGGTQVGTSTTNSYTDSGLTPTTNYSYTVSAYDTAGNVSAQSSAASATTLASGSGSVITPLTIQEALYSGSVAGVARTQDPVSVGIPLSQSANITNVSQLGLSGASVGQFRVEGCWSGAPAGAPTAGSVMYTSCGGGAIKWVLVDTEANIASPGAQNTNIALTTGSGNFGGSNLATDNGATITVNTGSGQFTIKKANFDVIDQAVVNGTTLVAPGTSQGMTVLGPNPNAAYPGNVTCAPTPGGTPCTTVYSSANDPNSTAVIEENGPTETVIKATGHHLDASGHSYMAFTVRLYFSKNQNSVKVVSELQNADYGTSNTYASAAKGYQGYELRITPNLTGALTYTFGNNTQTPTTGTMSAGDSVYLYQAESVLMKKPTWCTDSVGCVVPSPLSGYAIMKNGAPLLTGTASQYPQGWADISNSSGAGLEIGQYELAAYGDKSLEFQNGGTDVRIGIAASENNTTGVTATTANQPYYLAWPQYSINTAYLIFHGSASASPANDFLKMQFYLMARAPGSYYNSTDALFDTIIDPNEESAYYASVIANATPSVSGEITTPTDLGTVDTYNWPLTMYRYWLWGNGGVTNQTEFRYSHLLEYLERGFTGGYLDSASFYNLVAESAFPRTNGTYQWMNEPGSQTQYMDFPTAISANSSLAMQDPIELDMEHGYWWGMPTYYYMSGDQTIYDTITDGAKDAFWDTNSTNNETTNGKWWVSRSVGNVLSTDARMEEFLNATGDSADASTMLAQGQRVWDLQIKPDLCASGYPAGCTPDLTGGDFGANQRGTSKVRGVTFQWAGTDNIEGCPGYPNNSDRTFVPFMNGILVRGMLEFREAEGPSWLDYNDIFDTAYGITQASFGEMYVDNGANSWTGNGFRYKEDLDIANNCGVGPGGDYAVQNPNAFWPMFYLLAQYNGGATTAPTASWQREFNQSLQTTIAGGSAINTELYQYVIAQVIYAIDHPSGLSLTTVPLTNVVNNGGGSYTLSWTVPASTQSYRIKWGAKQIVDYIGFNSGTNTFIGNPTTTMNWFAATDTPNIPSPTAAGSVQSFTVTGLPTTLAAPYFMVKAYVGTGSQSTDTTPPSVPTGLATTVSSASSVNLSWTASTDNVGVVGYRIFRNGTQVGTSASSLYADTGLTGSTLYSYTVAAYDAAGNVSAQSSAISVTTPAALPGISNLVGSNTSSSSTLISWSTNILTNGQVFYGLSSAYGSTSALVDNSPKTMSHSIILANLVASTLYHFKATSIDALGNTTSSPDFTFTTLALPAAPAPTITLFSAGPSNISLGNSATLSWTASNATTLSINQSVGTVTGLTSKTVSPSITTTYTLTATNNSGSATAQATVTVGSGSQPTSTPPAITSFTATPASIVAGEGSTIAWTVTGNPAPSVSLTTIGNVLGITTTVTPGITTTYTLTAQNSAGSATAQSTVTVTPSTVAPSGGLGSTGGGGGGSTGGGPVTVYIPPVATTTESVAISTVPIMGITPANQSPESISLTATLGPGITGYPAQVTALQEFLQSESYLTSIPTPGLFGAATENAVEAFQCAEHIVCSGTPATTGYGQVGPKTRATINSLSGATGTSFLTTASMTDAQLEALIQQLTAEVLQLEAELAGLRAGSQAHAPASSTSTSLSLGSTGSEVSTLQSILNVDGYLAGGIYTQGTFDIPTERAVESFQCIQKIICSGPGYGTVGPRTRAALGM